MNSGGLFIKHLHREAVDVIDILVLGKLSAPSLSFSLFFLHLMRHFLYKGAIKKIYETEICH